MLERYRSEPLPIIFHAGIDQPNAVRQLLEDRSVQRSDVLYRVVLQPQSTWTCSRGAKGLTRLVHIGLKSLQRPVRIGC